jgi:hypothetical protein
MLNEEKLLDISGHIPGSLFDTLKVELSTRQFEKLSIIDGENFLHVARKACHELKKQGFSPTQKYLDGGVLALKQYYGICFLDPNVHAVSDVVDPFWHSHILHTVQYNAFCDRLIGKYMHHFPHDPESEQQIQALKVIYQHTQRAYRTVYNYVCPVFNPESIPDYRLVCKHYNDKVFFSDDMFFPLIQEVEQAKTTFLSSYTLQYGGETSLMSLYH